MFVTGPVAYTKAIHSIEQEQSIRFVRYDKDIGFVYNALSKSHTKVLSKHYANYKQIVVKQGSFIDSLSKIYILIVRLLKNSIKLIGRWEE